MAMDVDMRSSGAGLKRVFSVVEDHECKIRQRGEGSRERSAAHTSGGGDIP